MWLQLCLKCMWLAPSCGFQGNTELCKVLGESGSCVFADVLIWLPVLCHSTLWLQKAWCCVFFDGI